MNSDAPCFIDRFVFDLYPFEPLVFIRYQIKGSVLCHRVQNNVPLLEKIKLSLQNTQIAFVFGVMHHKMLPNTNGRVNQRFPRDCHQHDLLRFPRYSAVHFMGSVSP